MPALPLYRPGLLKAGICGLLLGLAPQLQALSDKDQIRAGEEELGRVRGRISELQTELKSAQERRHDLNLELQRVERNIGQLARRLRTLAGSLQRQGRHLKKLQATRLQQENELAHHHDTLSRQIRAAYAMGRQERLKILLNQQDPAMVSRVLVYYDYFNRARAEQLTQIETLVARLKATETKVVQEKSRLEALQAQQLNQRDQFKQARLMQRQVVKRLNGEIQSKGEVLNELKRDEQQLQALLDRLQQESAAITIDPVARKPFPSLKGRLPWPAEGRLKSRFGTLKQGGFRWDGVMIAAPEGREVRAVHHGRVAFADWLRGFGLLLIIEHGDGYMTLYGHNQSLFKETGEWVVPGETIALVGNSGGRLDTGIYFGIRHNGRPVSPTAWCEPIKGNRIGTGQYGKRGRTPKAAKS